MMRWIVLGLLLLAPLANADTVESAPVRMHFHVTGLQDFAVNTQPAPTEPGSYSTTVTAGVATASMCARDPASVQSFTNQAHHTWYGTSNHHTVDYEFLADGHPRLGMYRNYVRDVQLDPTKQPHVDWYVAAGGADVPSVLPVQLEVTVREGADVSVDDTAYNSGPIVAHGITEPITLQPGLDHPQMSHQVVNGNDVYGFHFPLEIHQSVIAAREGFNVRIDLYTELPCDEDHGWNPTLMGPHTSPTARPGMDWHMFDAIQIDAIRPQIVGDDLVVHTQASSPFGPHDVANHTMTIPRALAAPQLVVSAIDPCHAHHCTDQQHSKGTWVWDLDQERDGVYNITLAVQNGQGTATDSLTFQFQMGDGVYQTCQGDVVRECTTIHARDRDAAGPAMPLLLLALLLVRRR